MNSRRLHTVLMRHRASFLAAFPALTSHDLHTILAGPSETLLDLLQARYGYSRTQAKAAWNDFVLAYVDGVSEGRDAREPDGPGHAQASAQAPAGPAAGAAFGIIPALEPPLWHLMCLGWGRSTLPASHLRIPDRISFPRYFH